MISSATDVYSIERGVVRILFILYYCNDLPHTQSLPLFKEDYVCVINSESKLQKIDFWIRYPDHLAAALLRGCEPEGDYFLVDHANEIKELVRTIFREQEPDLRWVPMRKYFHGAHEPLDDIMSFLSSRWLAYLRVTNKRHQKRYYLTRKGFSAVEGILKECSEAQWYAARCKLINRFFGHLKGFEIRRLQYLEDDYDAAIYSEMIVRVKEEVARRFEKIFGEALL